MVENKEVYGRQYSARLSHKAIHMFLNPDFHNQLVPGPTACRLLSRIAKRSNGMHGLPGGVYANAKMAKLTIHTTHFPRISPEISKSLIFIVDSDSLYPVVAAD